MIQMNKKILIILIFLVLIMISLAVGYVFSNKSKLEISNTTEAYIPEDIKMANNKKEITYGIAECNYNNERLALNMPSNWKYEIIGDNVETGVGNYKANYGIKFYPNENDKEKYAGIYSLKEKLGVCGTGLVTEKITTEFGVEAEIGYFNAGKDWNYIAYKNKEGILVAFNNGLEGDIAKEALNILKTMNFIDNSNIEMTIKEGTLTKTSATLVIKSKDNSKNFNTGAWFEIEKQEDGKWIKLPMDSLLSWIAIAYIPNDNGVIETKVNWKDIYGELEKRTIQNSKRAST